MDNTDDVPFAEISTAGRLYKVCVPQHDRDYIQSGLVATGRPYEQGMLEAIAAELDPGDLVLDVGANIGNHTLYLAVVAAARVVAYEPNAELVAGLRRSVEANALAGRVTIRDVGVHAKAGRGRFATLNPANLGAQSIAVSGETGDFDVVALDLEPIAGRVAAIKIDVEGSELAVLAGAAELIARDRPRLYVECATVEEFRAVSDLLDISGYSLRGTFNLTPTHAFAPSSGTTQEREVARALVEATAEVYELKASNRALRSELAELRGKS